MSFHTMRLLIELSLSLHFFIRLRAAFGGGWWQAPVLLWMILMLAPMFLHETSLPRPVMNFLLYVFPIWLGFLLFFTLCTLAAEPVRLLTTSIGALAGKSWWPLLKAKRTVPVALLLALLLSAYSYYMAYNPRLVTLRFETGKLPAGVDALRIVQLTDIHLSRFVVGHDLRRIARLAASAAPDILVVTGDFVDTDMKGREDDAAIITSLLKPQYGAFAVFGNHERYAGEVNSAGFYQAAGLRLLRGEAEEAGGIIVAGVDDEVFGERGNLQPAGKLLQTYKDSGKFVLFLKHRPTLASASEEMFDLQLSGHTHGGQIWPGHFFIKRANGGLLHGLHYFSSKSAVYTSRGAGFWGLPMRFLAPPEVTLVELVRKN